MARQSALRSGTTRSLSRRQHPRNSRSRHSLQRQVSLDSGDQTQRLTDLHSLATMMHMRTTLILDDMLIEKAQEISGISGKTAVLHAGLEALIARASALRLAELGGTQPQLRAVRRRRPPVRTKA